MAKKMNMLNNRDPDSFETMQATAPVIPAFDARTLVGKDGIARIVLDGVPYILRITKANKLILTK
jgi:hemin uptake protein HemP